MDQMDTSYFLVLHKLDFTIWQRVLSCFYYPFGTEHLSYDVLWPPHIKSRPFGEQKMHFSVQNVIQVATVSIFAIFAQIIKE
jgi:hypothetical protein